MVTRLESLVWLPSEGDGAYNITQMQDMYGKDVDKDEYPTFLGWLYDMERSGTYYCHDLMDKMNKTFHVAHEELGKCPVCYGDSYRADYHWEDGLYIDELTCDDCGSDWSEVYMYQHSIITRIGR